MNPLVPSTGSKTKTRLLGSSLSCWPKSIASMRRDRVQRSPVVAETKSRTYNQPRGTASAWQ
eukprot:scaffold6743_cov158-Ochromonas_danica.AAC.12